MTALSAIEDFLLRSDARLCRVMDLYFYSCGSYSELRDELTAHPWFEADKNNRNIFKVVL